MGDIYRKREHIEECKAYGRMIRRERKARNWSVSELAYKVGMTTHEIRKIELGKCVSQYPDRFMRAFDIHF